MVVWTDSEAKGVDLKVALAWWAVLTLAMLGSWIWS